MGLVIVVAVVTAVVPLSAHASTYGRAADPSSSRASRVDFNGDGFADLATGAPYEDVNGHVDAGAVNVLYGGPGGLQVDAPADQYWTEDSPGVESNSDDTDRFGFSVAAGDFNADGYDDLIVGVPHKDVVDDVSGKLIGSAGAVNVLYGGAGGLQVDSPPDQFWTQATPGIHGRAEHMDLMGYSLAAGDFDRDGYDDVVIGDEQEDGGIDDIRKSGALNTIYGGPAGLQTAGDQHITQNDLGLNDPAEHFDYVGQAVASADFNQDGYDDVAAGIPYEDVGSIVDAGAVQIIYGGPNGLQGTAPDDQFFTQGSNGIPDTAETDDRLGWQVTAGDFNGDGFPDLAAGIPREDVGSITDAGAVLVLYGSTAGLQVASPPVQMWTQDSPDVSDKCEGTDRFGMSVAAGDFNADGTADLAVGIPQEELGSAGGAGAVQVFYGSRSSGLQAVSPDDQLWDQDSPNVEDKDESTDRFGDAVGSHDWNGDGFDDLTVGVKSEDIGSIADAGAVNVLFGSSSGVQATAPADQFWNQDSSGVEDSAEKGDQLGYAVA